MYNKINSFFPSPIITVFTGTITGLGAVFCAMGKGVVPHHWTYRLNDQNSLYQVELYAILKTLDCIKINNTHFIM